MKHKYIIGGLVGLLLVSCAPVPERPVPVVTTVSTTTPVTTSRPIGDPFPPIKNPDIPGGLQSGIGEQHRHLTYKEEDTVLLNASLALPIASVVGDEAMQQSLSTQFGIVENELMNRLDLLYQRYLQDYQNGIKGLTTPSVQIRFELHYFTAEAVSMTYIYTETTRDGIVYTDYYHSNIDLRVGSGIRLPALLKEETTDGLLTRILDKLTADTPDGLYANTEKILESKLAASWFICEDSLIVMLEAGEIAPLSSGTIVVTFSPGELEDLLSDYGKLLL